ncbi:hypothetical protein JNUCC83_03045 [Vagococcus sp. JNUCC 83]
MINIVMPKEVVDVHKKFFTKEIKKKYTDMILEISSENSFVIDMTKMTNAEGTFFEILNEMNQIIISKKLSKKDFRREDLIKKQIELLEDTIILKKMIRLSINLLDESNYYELLKLEEDFGEYLFKLDKLSSLDNALFCEITSYRIYRAELNKNLKKKKGKDNLKKKFSIFKFLPTFEKVFLDLYKERFTREIRYTKFQEIENTFHDLKDISILFKDKKFEKTVLKYWNVYLYTLFLDTIVCPYCNSQFIYTYFKEKGEKKGKVRPQIDHLFPKSVYPFLSVSIFNLIPSCSQCNSSIKGDNEVKLSNVINLFTESIQDEYHFYIKSKKGVDELLGKSSNYEIKIHVSEYFEYRERLIKFLNSFHLNERYNYFKNHLNEEIYYKVNHTKSMNSFINSLLSDLNDFDAINPSLMDFMELEDKNRLLGKLQRDILFDQLGNPENSDNIEYTDFYSG